MSRYVRVSGQDYRVRVATGGTIVLDTGNNVYNSTTEAEDWEGGVVITGDLYVMGKTTTIETQDTFIEDNIITLNKGESGSGVTKGTAGFEIDRGEGQDKASVLFQENIDEFTFKLGPVLAGIKTDSITTDNQNLLLLNNTTTARISVAGAPDYEERILNYDAFGELQDLTYQDPDYIPNIKAVADFTLKFFELNPPAKIQDSEIVDGLTILYDSILEIHDSEVDGGVSNLELQLDGVTQALWYADRHEVQDIRITGTTIHPTVSNTDLILKSEGSGSVTIDDNLKLTLQVIDPTQGDGIKVYAKSEAQGGTGLYFVNSDSTRDELISRRKAIAYSMIF